MDAIDFSANQLVHIQESLRQFRRRIQFLSNLTTDQYQRTFCLQVDLKNTLNPLHFIHDKFKDGADFICKSTGCRKVYFQRFLSQFIAIKMTPNNNNNTETIQSIMSSDNLLSYLTLRHDKNYYLNNQESADQETQLLAFIEFPSTTSINPTTEGENEICFIDSQ